MPRLSVLVPVHNDREYVDKCLEQLTRQKYRNVEFVVRDDASTDDTPDKVRQWAQRDSRIRFERNATNIKRVAQYRKLLHEDSRGDYIMVHDGNDHVQDEDYLERMMRPIDEAPGIRMAVGSMTLRIPGAPTIQINQPVLRRMKVDTYKTLTREEILDIIPSTPIWSLHGCTITENKLLLEAETFVDDRFPEATALPFLAPGDRIALVNAKGLVWDMRPGVSDTDLLGGRCGFGLEVCRHIMGRAKKARPGITPLELATLFCGSWSTLTFRELWTVCRDEIGLGPLLKNARRMYRIRLYCMARRRMALGRPEVWM